jgi:predicted small integral membrane protein
VGEGKKAKTVANLKEGNVFGEMSLLEQLNGLIIFAEFLTGLLLFIGAIGLLKNIHSPLAFKRAKNWAYLGCLVGLLLWFFGFIVIGGEWFCMWQPEKWNGIEATLETS